MLARTIDRADAMMGIARSETDAAAAGLAESAAAAGFERFYAATARDLWAYAAASLQGDATRADDVVQESFLRYLKASAPFENDEHRRRYVFRIAANLMEDDRRRSRRRPETSFSGLVREGEPEEGLPRVIAQSEGPAREVGAEERMDVRQALEQLQPRERRLLWLAHVEECSHEEIGARLGTKTKSVRVLLFRARRRLAAALESAGGSRRKESVR